jgi:hypothetical protein
MKQGYLVELIILLPEEWSLPFVMVWAPVPPTVEL